MAFKLLSASTSNTQSDKGASDKSANKRKKVGPYCCVTGCHSARGREEIGFFKVQRHSPSLTDAWARAIKRENKDGSLWYPSEWSVICGHHFLSEKPSIEPGNPDYIPSLFDRTNHNNKQSNKRKTNEDAERFNRHKERVLNPADQNPIEDQDDCNVEQVCLI